MRPWRDNLEAALCLLTLAASVFAAGFIPIWYKFSSWFIADTKCVIYPLYNNTKVWQPCTLTIRLQERCILINPNPVHCDNWKSIGATIVLIDIPLQTELIPSEVTADHVEMTIGALVFSVILAAGFCFDASSRRLLAVISVLIFPISSYCLIALLSVSNEAFTDHRPEVNYGYARDFYICSVLCNFIGAVTNLGWMIYRRKVDKPIKHRVYHTLRNGSEPEVFFVHDEESVELAVTN